MNTPRMHTAADMHGHLFQLNGVDIPVEQWNVDHGGNLGPEHPVRVQLTFYARFEPEPETAEQEAKRLRDELEAAVDEAVSQWQAARRTRPDLVPVFALHRPVYGYGPINCAHCEQSDGMESTENVPWPCATYRALTTDREQAAEADGCDDAEASAATPEVQPIQVTVHVNGEHVVDAWHLGGRS